jgi:hypothetical protein
MFNPTKNADVFVTVEGATDTAPAQRIAANQQNTTQREFTNEFARIGEKMKSEPRDTICCLLGLLEPPSWMEGSHSDEKGGWLDKRTEKVISFEDARKIIADRVAELGLDTLLVEAWPTAVHSFAESQAFWGCAFEERMKRFRSAGA